ncbi:MAG: hypothetical protein Q7O66_08410 [Dehalococcoidia bacterium]|nr:hypothetical protein [Dehalococcoidia bacterium]
MSERIGLSLEPPSLQVKVDGEAVVAVLTVENRSPIVDQYDVSIEGLEPAWYDLSGAVAGVFPGEKAQVSVSFHLPQTIQLQAGLCPFVVKVTSRSHPEDYSTAEGSLDILAFGDMTMQMSPERLEGREGLANLLLTNRSNNPVTVTMRATDAEEGLDFRFSAESVTVPVAGESSVDLMVKPKKRPRFGAVHEYQFSVSFQKEGEESAAQTAEGIFIYRPPLANLPVALRSLWLRLKPILPLLLSLLALAFAALTYIKPLPTPTPGAPSVPPPVIQSFRSESGPGGTIFLKWQVQGAKQVRLDGKDVDPEQGSSPISSLQNKEYTLEAANEGSSVYQRLGIVVLKPPTITAFEAQPAVVDKDGTATLSWKVENATSVSVDGTLVDKQEVASGKRQVKVDQTRDYVLLAENDTGWVVRRVAVQTK